MTPLHGRSLVCGSARGRSLKLTAPISFWGGVDPTVGRIVDPRHPNYNLCITDRVIAIPGTVGSSSSSAIMLELLRLGTAPAALLLGTSDAILVLGVLIAEEIGHPTIPVVALSQEDLASIPDDAEVHVSENGDVHWSSRV